MSNLKCQNQCLLFEQRKNYPWPPLLFERSENYHLSAKATVFSSVFRQAQHGLKKARCQWPVLAGRLWPVARRKYRGANTAGRLWPVAGSSSRRSAPRTVRSQYCSNGVRTIGRLRYQRLIVLGDYTSNNKKPLPFERSENYRSVAVSTAYSSR